MANTFVTVWVYRIVRLLIFLYWFPLILALTQLFLFKFNIRKSLSAHMVNAPRYSTVTITIKSMFIMIMGVLK